MLLSIAVQKYAASDPYWPVCLVLELEAQQQGKALNWALDCMCTLKELSANNIEYRLDKWISDFKEVIANKIVDVDLKQISNDVWQYDKNVIFKALSNMYACYYYLNIEDVRMYRKHLVDSICLMGTHEKFKENFNILIKETFMKYNES
jgi:hypothetical protein